MPSGGEIVEWAGAVYKFMQVSFYQYLVKNILLIYFRQHGTSGKQQREYGNFSVKSDLDLEFSVMQKN